MSSAPPPPALSATSTKITAKSTSITTPTPMPTHSPAPNAANSNYTFARQTSTSTSTSMSKAPTEIHPAPILRPQNSHTHSMYDLDEEKKDHVTIDVSEDPDPEGDKNGEQTQPSPLQVFHTALGIPPPKPVKQDKPSKKNPTPEKKEQPRLSSRNRGVYEQVVSCERNARWKYFFCDAVVTVAMFLQIIVGASVTAFGAGKASPILITAFGAANTALASLLAVLKSQGLPNRIRQDWNMWRELKEYIEEKEREIELIVTGQVEGHMCAEDVWKFVRDIESRYQNVRLTAEANRPDTYIRVPLPGGSK